MWIFPPPFPTICMKYLYFFIVFCCILPFHELQMHAESRTDIPYFTGQILLAVLPDHKQTTDIQFITYNSQVFFSYVPLLYLPASSKNSIIFIYIYL